MLLHKKQVMRICKINSHFEVISFKFSNLSVVVMIRRGEAHIMSMKMVKRRFFTEILIRCSWSVGGKVWTSRARKMSENGRLKTLKTF